MESDSLTSLSGHGVIDKSEWLWSQIADKSEWSWSQMSLTSLSGHGVR